MREGEREINVRITWNSPSITVSDLFKHIYCSNSERRIGLKEWTHTTHRRNGLSRILKSPHGYIIIHNMTTAFLFHSVYHAFLTGAIVHLLESTKKKINKHTLHNTHTTVVGVRKRYYLIIKWSSMCYELWDRQYTNHNRNSTENMILLLHNERFRVCLIDMTQRQRD